MASKEGDWIAGAIKHPGALTKTAKAKGDSISQLCAGHTTGKTAKRCALSETLARVRNK
jgi:hypothetical protein